MKTIRQKKGFTLIEAVVVVGIISIMVGIMLPFIYRVWESNEIVETKEKMSYLKKAMVGDSRLIQNGVRTHYGYAGDIGQLPSSLGNLISNIDGVSNYNGPYLAPGFDSSKYNMDAWNTVIQYTPATVSGKRISAELRSYGPDRTAATADDIVDTNLQVYQEEVLPVNIVQGNANITFQTAPVADIDYYIGVSVTYRNGLGVTISEICCDSSMKTISGNPGNTEVNYSQNFSCNPVNNLPVGTVFVTPGVFSNNICTASLGGTPLSLAVNVSNSSIFTNVQIQSVP